MQPEDLKTLMKIKAGSQYAYNTFYQLYGPRLLATVYFLCNDKALAEDIVQESFLRLWLNRSMLNENQSLKGYLRTISKNLFLDHVRKNKTEKVYNNLLAEPISFDTRDRIAFKELNKIIFNAISAFSAEKQEMYIGSRFNGKSYNEIAIANNTTPKAVERHIAKISIFIKAYLKKHYFILF
ncbi:RNA polymerase sigma factor [Pedobacter immunditicola]|uniref:RNA polymerase sigma factor n=1 Tax=Pedobacter immunditicola TaxID=3133440 RepID=UPI0030B0E02C